MKKKKDETEDLSREQAIVDEATKTMILSRIKHDSQDNYEKIIADMTVVDVKTISRYLFYLENQIDGFESKIDNPPGHIKDWGQKDMQIIMRDSGPTNFQENAKIINLSGRVLVHRSIKGYIQAILEEAPEDMRFTLIEEMPRIQKKAISAVVDEKRVTITFDDESTEIVKIKDSEDEWK